MTDASTLPSGSMTLVTFDVPEPAVHFPDAASSVYSFPAIAIVSTVKALPRTVSCSDIRALSGGSALPDSVKSNANESPLCALRAIEPLPSSCTVFAFLRFAMPVAVSADAVGSGAHATSRPAMARTATGREMDTRRRIWPPPPREVSCLFRLGRLRLLVHRLLVDLEDGEVLRRHRERDHAGDEPVGPHLVDLRLEVLDVFVDEVREAALSLQVLVDRLALLPTFGDLPRRAGEVADAVHDLVQRPDPGLDREVPELLAVLRVVVPALRARVERVNERGSAKLERLADRVRDVHSVGGTSRGDVTRFGVTRREHAGHVLLPAGVHEPFLVARWRERRDCAVRRLTGELDVRVRVRLVVVQQYEAVVVLVRERRGDRADAHVGAAAVTAERDDGDLLVLQLAFAHEDLEPGRGPERRC